MSAWYEVVSCSLRSGKGKSGFAKAAGPSLLVSEAVRTCAEVVGGSF